jgi:hypothetical protein
MHWQDWVLTIGSFVFIIALIPSLMSKDKPALFTSLLTGFFLCLYTGVYASLNLRSSTISTGILALAWLMLGVQKFLQTRKK